MRQTETRRAGTAQVVAASTPVAEPKVQFAFGDFTWMNGQSHHKSQFVSIRG